MAEIIRRQNAAIKLAQQNYPGQRAETNQQLARILGISQPPLEHRQVYADNDIRVTVI